MPFQLLLRHSDAGDLSALFARGRSFSFPEMPFRLSEKDGLPVGELSFREESGVARVKNCGESPVLLGESPLAPGEEGVLRQGGAIRWSSDDRELLFYRLHGRPGASAMANAMGYLAILGVVIAFVVEIGVCVGLSRLLMKTDAVQNQVEAQALTNRVDVVRKRLKSKEITSLLSKDTLSETYLEALRQEMEQRVGYLRRYGEELTPQERQAQMANLERLEAFLDSLEAGGGFSAEAPEILIDGPVDSILENP